MRSNYNTIKDWEDKVPLESICNKIEATINLIILLMTSLSFIGLVLVLDNKIYLTSMSLLFCFVMLVYTFYRQYLFTKYLGKVRHKCNAKLTVHNGVIYLEVISKANTNSERSIQYSILNENVESITYQESAGLFLVKCKEYSVNKYKPNASVSFNSIHYNKTLKLNVNIFENKEELTEKLNAIM